MRLLYIVNKSINMNTSASIRNKATILGLIELGHSVDVLTPAGSSSHPSFDESLNISSEQIKMLYIPINSKLLNMKNGIRKLKKITNSLYNTKRKFDIYSGETISISRIERLNLNYKKYDLIISSSDPKASHLLAEQIIDKNALKIPWIQIWGDPFLGDITNNNYVNKKRIYNEEKKLLSKANKVVYVSPFTLENQKIIYSEFAKKMYFYPIPYLNISLFQCNVSNRITLLYAGDYNSKIRNILPLYNSIAEENEKFKLNLVGNSDYILKNSNNISIQTRISYDEVKLLEKEADILVHLSNKHGTQIPGKIYQYSGTNKPILFILDGNEEEKRNIKNYFSQFDRYYFCENNENSIINILLQIKKDIKEKKYVPVKDFDKKIIAQNILKEVL